MFVIRLALDVFMVFGPIGVNTTKVKIGRVYCFIK